VRRGKPNYPWVSGLSLHETKNLRSHGDDAAYSHPEHGLRQISKTELFGCRFYF